MRKNLITIMLFLVVVFVLSGGSPLALLLPCLLGMAKVTGPLFSISASGKIADAMVHFPWKGRNVVRKWLKPSNPKTTGQGDRRLVLGGLGKGCTPIDTASQYAVYARDAAGTGQTWISALVGLTIDTWYADTAAYEAMVAEYTALPQMANWHAVSQTLGMTHFDVDYKGTASLFVAGHQLYAIAKYAFKRYTDDHSKFAAAPYTADPAGWGLEAIEAMAADFASL